MGHGLCGKFQPTLSDCINQDFAVVYMSFVKKNFRILYFINAVQDYAKFGTEIFDSRPTGEVPLLADYFEGQKLSVMYQRTI